MTHDPFAQRVIAGRYRLVRKLGEGGFGMVYQAEHVELGRPCALKFLHRQFESNEQFLKRFQREARLTAQLNHPNIVTVTDYGADPFLGHFFVMEYLSGETLSARLKRTGPMPSGQAVALMCDVVKAFAYAHGKGVIHRDVKSANVLLVTDESHVDQVKILDFGIARLAESGAEELERLTQSGMLMGSLSYMSPEQAEGKAVDARADVYSLGVVLYEVVTGQVPFKADSQLALLRKQVEEPPVPPSRTRPGLSVHPHLEMITLRCLQKRPEARFQSASEMLAELDKAREAIQTGRDIPLALLETTQDLTRRMLEDGTLDLPEEAPRRSGRTMALPKKVGGVGRSAARWPLALAAGLVLLGLVTWGALAMTGNPRKSQEIAPRPASAEVAAVLSPEVVVEIVPEPEINAAAQAELARPEAESIDSGASQASPAPASKPAPVKRRAVNKSKWDDL